MPRTLCFSPEYIKPSVALQSHQLFPHSIKWHSCCSSQVVSTRSDAGKHTPTLTNPNLLTASSTFANFAFTPKHTHRRALALARFPTMCNSPSCRCYPKKQPSNGIDAPPRKLPTPPALPRQKPMEDPPVPFYLLPPGMSKYYGQHQRLNYAQRQ